MPCYLIRIKFEILSIIELFKIITFLLFYYYIIIEHLSLIESQTFVLQIKDRQISSCFSNDLTSSECINKNISSNIVKLGDCRRDIDKST